MNGATQGVLAAVVAAVHGAPMVRLHETSEYYYVFSVYPSLHEPIMHLVRLAFVFIKPEHLSHEESHVQPVSSS
jgi:hypothetical protein